jgi:cytochrome P450
LARMEMKVCITEFLRRIPDFRVREGARIEYYPGGVIGPKLLPLTW